MHVIVDNLCNNALAAGLTTEQLAEEPKPINGLNEDPARKEYMRAKVQRNRGIKLRKCTICGRELPLGQFRSSDNHLHDECNACREERKEELKNKRKKKSA